MNLQIRINEPKKDQKTWKMTKKPEPYLTQLSSTRLDSAQLWLGCRQLCLGADKPGQNGPTREMATPDVPCTEKWTSVRGSIRSMQHDSMCVQSSVVCKRINRPVFKHESVGSEWRRAQNSRSSDHTQPHEKISDDHNQAGFCAERNQICLNRAFLWVFHHFSGRMWRNRQHVWLMWLCCRRREWLTRAKTVAVLPSFFPHFRNCASSNWFFSPTKLELIKSRNFIT